MSAATSTESLVLVPEKTSRLGVVERVTQILDAFTDASGRLLLEDVTRITGLPRSTAFRILGQLIDLHWIEYDAPGYRLGPRATTLAARVCDYEDIRAAAAVALNELHIASGAVVHLSVLEGGVVHYLDKVGPVVCSSVPSRVGARIIASDTVSGRALLAQLTPEYVDAALASATNGRASASDMATLHRELALIRQRRGIAFSAGERRRSRISSIAVPVLGPRGAVAAISVATTEPLAPNSIAPVLLHAARCTARNLYPDWASAQNNRPGLKRVT